MSSRTRQKVAPLSERTPGFCWQSLNLFITPAPATGNLPKSQIPLVRCAIRATMLIAKASSDSSPRVLTFHLPEPGEQSRLLGLNRAGPLRISQARTLQPPCRCPVRPLHGGQHSSRCQRSWPPRYSSASRHSEQRECPWSAQPDVRILACEALVFLSKQKPPQEAPGKLTFRNPLWVQAHLFSILNGCLVLH